MVLVPKIIRWQFKMETDQVLKVGISTPGRGFGIEWFYAKMKKEGRIRVPKLIVMKLESGKSLLGYILEVTLEPV
jgi:hypothetical protein